MTRERRPTVDQVLKAAPLFARAAIAFEAKLYLAGEGDSSGGEITPAIRDELLGKLATGAHVAIDADILAFEQRAGVPNRNFIGFRDGSLIALGVSGKGTPFLRDHKQWDSMSVAGRIVTSKTTKVADGQYEMRQRVRLTAAWAVELALRDLLFGVSIGWEPTGPVICSVHEAPICTECWCWPGMRLAETTDSKGNKKYEYNRAGTVRAQWIYTDASLIETSMCPIGAVKRAGFEGVRAALSFAGVDDETLAQLEFDHRSSDPQPVLTTEPPIMNNAPALAAALSIVVLTESQALHYARLSDSDRTAFAGKTSAERDTIVAAALAADPEVYKTKAGVAIRRSHGELALAQAKQLDAQAEALEAQRSQLEQATDAARTLTLRARAGTEIGHLAGTDDVKVAVLRALDGISDEATRLAAVAMLKGADAAMLSLGKPKGSDVTEDPKPDSPEGKLEALAAKIAERDNVSLEIARAKVFDSPEGERLYNEIEVRKSKARAAQFTASA